MAKEKKIMVKEETLAVCKEKLKKIANEKFKKDFDAFLRSRTPLIYVTSNEENRFIDFLRIYCKVNGYSVYIWCSFLGLIDLISGEVVAKDLDPISILEYIYNKGQKVEGQAQAEDVEGILFVLLDYYRYLEDASPQVERRIKALSSVESIIATIVTGSSYDTTPAIDNLFAIIDFPYPNPEEIKSVLCRISDGVIESIPDIQIKTKKNEEQLIKAATGLTLREVETAYSKSLVYHRDWNVGTILEEKRQIIKKNGMLEYYDPKYTVDDIGGLNNVITWLKRRKNCFSDEAKKYGLSTPRGVLFLGAQGAGKSLVCKIVSSMWEMPLLRLDFGKMFGSLVGDSERNIRSVLKLAESVAPCVIWLDEIDKALAGGKSSGVSDGGTTSRVIGTFLTWMQEKEVPVFVVATANDHKAIPIEFQRAGRFDETFFVDLPNEEEREEIFSVILRRKGILPDPKIFNFGLLSANSENYSGAEIEKSIEEAMLIGFEDNKRDIQSIDISTALSGFKPLYEQHKEEFETMRTWARTRCVLANSKKNNKTIYGSEGKKNLNIK